MAERSAGILMYRFRGAQLEVLLAHPGGPFWASKDAGAWSVPKGEIENDENPLEAAKREFVEEIGSSVHGNFIPLDPIKQAGGKWVYAWAVEGDVEAEQIRSQMFSIEWPPRSGKRQEFPEVDRAAWFPLEVARAKILKSQLRLLDQLQQKLARLRKGVDSV